MKKCLWLLLLAGCAVGPNYHKPKANAPGNWSEPQLGGTTNATVQIVEWWKTFNDAELNTLIERAVKANYDLRIAEGRVREARALRGGVAWDLGPTIIASGVYIDSKKSKNAQPSPPATRPHFRTELYNVGFDARWEIDVFGGKRRALESANALYEGIEDGRRAVLISVLAEVARNYVEVRGFQQRLAITENNLKAQMQAVEIANARFRAGLTSELDVKQAETLLATTQAQVPTLDTFLKQGIHRLGVLLGQHPGALLTELATDAPLPATPPTVPVGLPSDLLRRRPDVRRAERDLAASSANIGVQTAELFPKFSLIGVGGFQSLSASDWIAPGSKYWSAGPTVTWRLLDFGRINAQVKAATAQQAQALAAYEQTVLIAFEDVENALVAYANEQVRYRALSTAVAANRRALEMANELYTKGLGDFLNVLVTQRALYQVEDQLADSQRAIAENLVMLYKALGGGWENQYDVASKK